ncbi:MAG: family 65 glycosyl hydrolase domain-containing protein [Flavobacteriaceae bacterium]|tara:strand:- start:5425 stop:7707 length:2283 start_codon:yes stop_codon:yes gene_type:complete
MKKSNFKVDPWKIIKNGFDQGHVKACESIFSLGNGFMGQRANFEEQYSGETYQGSYIGGVYYPDKTKVGWWKNGYPKYFAKVLNAPNWIGINIRIAGIPLDLNRCIEVSNFRRELDMKRGIYKRSFKLKISTDIQVAVNVTRFLSMVESSLGVINYQITMIKGNAEIEIDSFVDGDIKNYDSNWDDPFWDHKTKIISKELLLLQSKTFKSNFDVATYAQTQLFDNNGLSIGNFTITEENQIISQKKKHNMAEGDSCTILKFGGYINGMNHNFNDFKNISQKIVSKAISKGFDKLAEEHIQSWNEIWDQSDIKIKGDDKAQQAIRFNIFQLNQTYNGADARLNIGPKGFTGEKYGGSTYWDTEAFCLPFYMATKNQNVARNLLKYRYDQLGKAIENAEKLGFTDGAALYPMVTMNGEECHNEWEITFEEIHRNGAIAYAIFNYERYTGDKSYIPEMGLEVLIGIARFWAQRVNYSEFRKAFVILGVTGPNEYENNINNNWYTNFICHWCLKYTLEQIVRVKDQFLNDWEVIKSKLNWRDVEADRWKDISDNMYFPKHPYQDIFLQQDNFLDKNLMSASTINENQRPINQHWSWDRILRSPFIKQADVLQGFYFFEDQFDKASLERHFNFYEPLTVHESSLSPCIHAILAMRLGKKDKAYDFYLQTSRLDLDDYNNELEEGLHITSMAGTWLSIIEGFGGLRVINDQIHINPMLPDAWKAFSFKINFRGTIVKVEASEEKISVKHNNKDLIIYCNGSLINSN